MTEAATDDIPGLVAESDLPGVPDGFQRLWTPHRMAYIQAGADAMRAACPFCAAPHKSDEDGLIVHRGHSAFVLLNLFPYNSGHLLICPYRHVATYDEATAEEVDEIGILSQHVSLGVGIGSFAAVSYGVVILAALSLPETRGKQLEL